LGRDLGPSLFLPRLDVDSALLGYFIEDRFFQNGILYYNQLREMSYAGSFFE
jgi:hypothetical protein